MKNAKFDPAYNVVSEVNLGKKATKADTYDLSKPYDPSYPNNFMKVWRILKAEAKEHFDIYKYIPKKNESSYEFDDNGPSFPQNYNEEDTNVQFPVISDTINWPSLNIPVPPSNLPQVPLPHFARSHTSAFPVISNHQKSTILQSLSPPTRLICLNNMLNVKNLDPVNFKLDLANFFSYNFGNVDKVEIEPQNESTGYSIVRCFIYLMNIETAIEIVCQMHNKMVSNQKIIAEFLADHY